MANIKKYNGSTWENTTARKYETATETIQSGDTIYADGTAATVSLKGNEQHTGTPSPSSPVDVVGVGERTENIITNRITGAALNSSGVVQNAADYDLLYGKVEPNKTYTIQLISSTIACVFGYFAQEPVVNGVTYDGTRTVINFNDDPTPTVTIPTGVNYIAIRVNSVKDVMVNEGSTIKPYEPYGYKIPILNGQTTTPIYLGSTASIRQIYKLVLNGQENWSNQNVGLHGAVSILKSEFPLAPDMAAGTLNIISTHFKTISNSAQLNVGEMVAGGSYLNFDYDGENNLNNFKTFLQQQYTAGTPVTVWYVLATPTTATVNEPLQKIGTYADSISGISLPTTEGDNSITVDTTVQPSEFTATWTGWHDASVKEYMGGEHNLFDDTNVITIAGLGDRYGVILPNGTYSIYNGTDNTVFDGVDNFQYRHVACEPHSTATVTLNTREGSDCGFIMALEPASQGGVTIVTGKYHQTTILHTTSGYEQPNKKVILSSSGKDRNVLTMS